MNAHLMRHFFFFLSHDRSRSAAVATEEGDMSAARNAPAPRVARAATRYRPGQAPANAGDTYSDDEDEGQGRDNDAHDTREDMALDAIADISRGTRGLTSGPRRGAGIVLQTGDGPISSGGKSTQQQLKMGAGISAPRGPPPTQQSDGDGSSEYETDTDDDADDAGPSRPVFRKPGLASSAPLVKPSPADESSEYETDSGEEEEEDEEEAPQLMPKPIFKSKAAPVNNVGKDGTAVNGAEAGETDIERRAREQAEERRKQSHQLAEHTIKRELAEREADEAKPDLDDTDGKDPEAEFSAWRQRETARLERERQAIAEKEDERREVERRRAMPEEQRLAEDTKRAQESRSEKKKGDMGFMEKYYHKGSFFQDLDILKKRDYTQGTENAVDKRLLPKMMQVRDYGKASRSKWTHLSNEDTTKRQEDPRFKGMSGNTSFAPRQGSSTEQGCFNCGGPHLRRDCPEPRQSGRHDGHSGPGRGANTVPVRVRDASRGDTRNGHSFSRKDGPDDGRSRYGKGSGDFDDRREEEYDRRDRRADSRHDAHDRHRRRSQSPVARSSHRR